MKLISNLRVLTATVLAAYLGVGCALTSTDAAKLSPTTPYAFDALVSKDVVSVLRQVERLAPTSTTLGTSDASLQRSSFADALKQEFQAAGYAIRAVAAGSETLPVSYSSERSDAGGVDGVSSAATQSSQTITVTVGDVAVRRTYIAQADGQVVPVGKMQVRGVDASKLKLDNEIFSTPALKARKSLPPVAPSTTKVVSGEQLVDANQRPQVQELPSSSQSAQIIVPQDSPQEPSDSIASLTANSASRPLLDLIAPSVVTAKPQSFDTIGALAGKSTQNIRELQQSNFESLFAEMGIVGEKVLTFANDSTRMGDLNKARLSELLQSFNPESDILSVIGCSLGPTAYSGGQEGLARGRAKRVREELLYAGIPDSKILAEGCWAEETFDERMPRRGVVVTLKRPIS